MQEFLNNRSLYHAKTGNFTGFCVSLPLNLQEEELYSLFTDVRANLHEIEEEKETWFTLAEFREFQNNEENKIVLLTELASITTRMKLRRAAKRTAKRRSRKRFMRRKIRKNRSQLKKRAYSQVKTILRKRLSGGRPWSKISLSTRSRIDSSINKRKSILIRMVNNRVPKMAGQETKRLQRTRLNNSYEFPDTNLILEDKKGPSAKGSKAPSSNAKQNKKENARNRQRRRQEKLKNNVTEFIKTVVIAKSGGKWELIEKDSIQGQIDIKQLKSVGDALSVCKKIKDGEFRQTKTSDKLCGKLQGPSKANERKSQGNTEMSSSNKSTDEVLPIEPQIPFGEQPGDPNKLPEKLKGGKGGFAINENYKAVALEMGLVLASRMNRSGNTDIEDDLQDLQSLMENTEDLTNDDVDTINEIYDRLNESGLKEDEILFLASNKDLYSASIGQFRSAFQKQDIEGNVVYKRLSQFGFNDDTIENYAMVQMGRSSVGVMNPDLDGTSKSDIVAVHIPTVLAFLEKTENSIDLSEKQLNNLIIDHVNNINIGTGGSSKNKKEQIAGMEYYEKFQKWIKKNKSEEADKLRSFNSENTTPFSGIVGISVKAGASRIGSSNVTGDGLNTLKESYKRALKAFPNDFTKERKDFEKQMGDLLDSIKTGNITATTLTSTYDQARSNAQPSAISVEETKEKLTKIIQNMTSVDGLKNKFNIEFTKELLRISSTGESRINSISPGIATHLLVSGDPKSTNANFLSIDDEFIETLLEELKKGKGPSDVIINFVAKSGGDTSIIEKQYEEKFDNHVKKVANRLKELKDGEKLGNLTVKSTKKDIEDEIIGNIYSAYDKLESDFFNGNRDELIAKLETDAETTGQDPNDITSELYLMKNDIRDKRYKLRIVLNIIKLYKKLEEKENRNPSSLSMESFSFSPVLKFLVEQYSVLKEEQTENEPEQTKESVKSQLDDYMNKAKRSIGTGPGMLGNLMEFFETDFDLFTDNINFTDIIIKDPTNYTDTNSIFINNKEIKVPISEYYKTIGSMFLVEAKKKRDYKEEYKKFHGKPDERKKRSKRVLARRLLAKMGKVSKGDGKDVDHKDGNAMNNSPSNLRAISASKNRSKH